MSFLNSSILRYVPFGEGIGVFPLLKEGNRVPCILPCLCVPWAVL